MDLSSLSSTVNPGFFGQLGRGYEPEEDMEKIGRLIDRLPNTSLRIRLWGELAMRLFLRKHSDAGNRVVREQIVPLLDPLPNGEVKSDTIVSVAPALYRNHKTTALEVFDTLEGYQRDRALMLSAKFILESNIPSDPYESHELGYEITYQDAVDVTELADQISRDNLVYSLILALGDTLGPSSRFSKTFSRQQKAQLAERISELISYKFPDPINIQHNGFAIASQAQILRILRGKRKSWEQVIEDAKKIPNCSDRSFVLAVIGQILPSRESKKSEAVFKDAISLTQFIPCAYDRLVRLGDLAEMMLRKFPTLAKECLSDANGKNSLFEDGGNPAIFKGIIDTAFKLDPEFAASLVSLYDDDPARAIHRHQMNQRLQTLEKKRTIIGQPKLLEENESRDPELPRSAWLALGSLNAGRVHPASLEQLRPILRAAGKYPLRDGYPLLSWFIENVVRRFSGSPQSRSTIRVIFDGTLRATELAEIAGASASVTVRRGDLIRK